MGSSNEKSTYGPVKNPVDPNKVPGGSSGGSAAAVSEGLCLVSLGSDTGGSIRQPAAFCGVIGLKPTYSRVSRYGLIAYASSFDQIGPIANNIEDIALVLEVISGKDKNDSTSSSLEVPNFTKVNSKQLNKKIAYLSECINHPGLDHEIRQNFLMKIDELKHQGFVVEPISFPLLDYLVATYYVLSTAEASSNLARFDGINYANRTPNAKNLNDSYVLSRNAGFATLGVVGVKT
jgi:aspartyl-tRNA(Asn)/glutamyl-tRNA(Gln) amidotransferase subunit A